MAAVALAIAAGPCRRLEEHAARSLRRDGEGRAGQARRTPTVCPSSGHHNAYAPLHAWGWEGPLAGLRHVGYRGAPCSGRGAVAGGGANSRRAHLTRYHVTPLAVS